MTKPRIALASAMLCVSVTGLSAEPFRVVALGDAPYGEPAEAYPAYEALIGAINATDPALVIHVGDTKSGGTPCSDQVLADQLAFMEKFAAPVLYTPGDNEWTDCHREVAGGFDPSDRLNFIRDTYFAEPYLTLGQVPISIASQAKAGYPENARLRLNDVVFLTAHVVGSNNNFEIRDFAAVEEFMARDVATVDWLRDGFRAAAEAEALVVAIHADMFEFDFNEFGEAGWLRHSGFANFGEALKAESAAYGKPVLIVYGDSHVFRQTRPFPDDAPNVLALEVPGADDMHAVEITVETGAPGAFSISLLRNPALSN